jgi:DNA modification methylase
MEWGGRLIGACALNIPNYIDIDINENLKEPYEKMTRELNKYSNTEIHLFFQDALTIDYSKFKYDMVFTSPPYYNIEIYNGTHKRSKQEWNNNFYIPLITNTWKYLQKGGHFCFNVPQNIYEDICVPLLGKAHLFEPLILTKRGNGINYKEYIYIWIK